MPEQGMVIPLFTEPHGGLRCKTFPKRKLEELIENGYGFDGSSCYFCDVEDSDLLAVPDPATKLEFDGHVLLVCDIYKAGERYELDPRYVLERAVRRLGEAGLDVLSGTEMEFYLLDRRSNPGLIDSWRYMEPVFPGPGPGLIFGLVEALEASGLGIVFFHHEVGPGQYEVTLERADPRELADKVIIFKWATRRWAWKKGLLATFMPKPFIDRPGNGMHIHLSLWRDGKNVTGPGGKKGDGKRIFSEEGQAFLAGILAHAGGLSVLLSPTVNSYKRLMPGFEAPIYVCWGMGNRSALVRIPEHDAARGRLRIEVRSPDPACNPYLALAGLLTAGLKGIEDGLEAPEPIEENVYELGGEELEHLGIEKLPSSLGEAIEAAKKDRIIVDALGPKLAERYLALKEAEWRAYLKFLEESGATEQPTGITSWELEEYLERP